MNQEKTIYWIGSSKEDLLEFPEEVRRKAGFQLRKIQSRLEPDDWKALDNIDAGIKEIRLRDNVGIYRVIYVAKFENAVYVLHCFQKKTMLITKQNKEVIITRYRAVRKLHNNK